MKQLSLLPEDDRNWTNDDWQTPEGSAIAMSRLVKQTDLRILEPCAGTGQIAKFLPDKLGGLNTCCEINPARFRQGMKNAPGCCWINGDFLEVDVDAVLLTSCEFIYDLIIGNPPFSKCVEFIERSLSLLDIDNNQSRILFLLPIDWNCGKARAAAWKKLDAHIHHEYRIEGRIAFLDANGIPQPKRQIYDAVFDIRLGRRFGGVSYL
jgi:hypothetical protein